MRTRLIVLSVLPLFFSNAAVGEIETDYFAVFIEGKKSGHAIRTRSVADGKVTTTETVAITMNRAGVLVPIKSVESCIETTDGKPLGFQATQDLGAMTMTVKGTVTAEGTVELTIDSAAGVQAQTIQWPSEALMSEGLRLLTQKKGLAEGTTFTTKLFSPGMLAALDADIRIGPRKNVDLLGRVVVLTEVTTILKLGVGQIVSTSFIDQNMKEQKAIVPVAGITMEMVSCPKQFALAGDEPADLIEKTIIPCPVSLAEAASAKSIEYHLVPTGTAKLQVEPNDNQTVRSDGKGGLIITVRPVPAPGGVKFPYKGSNKRAVEAMKATRFIQSENNQIISLAQQAIGGTKDAAEAARRIEAFVGHYIEQRNLSVGYASAVEVAASKQGDCSEHAVLTAAMCRSVGIPAEVVMGLVYVDEFLGRKNVFGGHAWVQACIGDKWIGLDATRTAKGYDPRHIALAAGNGNPEDFFDLVTTLGNFKITEVRPGK